MPSNAPVPASRPERSIKIWAAVTAAVALWGTLIFSWDAAGSAFCLALECPEPTLPERLGYMIEYFPTMALQLLLPGVAVSVGLLGLSYWVGGRSRRLS